MFTKKLLTTIVIAVILAGAVTLLMLRDTIRPPKYNILLISVDTLRADRLNCYGYKARTVSPHIDALARDGILFDNHISASPWTTPAHMSLITSLHPTTHGVNLSFIRLSEALEADRNYVKLSESRATLAEVLQQHGLITGAFTGGATVDPRIGFGQGFDVYETDMFKLTDQNMGAMYDWLTTNASNPFFLFWHNFEVHAPYLNTQFIGELLPADKAADLARDIDQWKDTVISTAGQRDGRERSRSGFYQILERHGAARADACEAMYVGSIRSIDQWLGQCIDTLRRKGLYDRTMIVFTSDHGEEFADHFPSFYYDSHGHSLYEEMIRVPLIIKLPKQEYAGTKVSSVTRTIDIMPTVLDIMTFPGPRQMQGDSLRPLWETPGEQPPRFAFSEAAAFEYEKKCIRTQNYKCVITISEQNVAQHGRSYIPPKLRGGELFDLKRDPGETSNLKNHPQGKYNDLVHQFEQRLRQHIAGQEGSAEPVQLDQETIDQIKSLGYVK